MQTKFDIGDEVFVTAVVKQCEIDEDNNQYYKVALCVDTDLTVDDSEIYIWTSSERLMLKKKVGAK